MNIPEPATFADDLDGFGASLFLVDKTSRRIVHANARAMLRERSVLREGDGWLRVGGDENTKDATSSYDVGRYQQRARPRLVSEGMLRRPRLRAGHDRADPGYVSARPAVTNDAPVGNDDHHQAWHGRRPERLQGAGVERRPRSCVHHQGRLRAGAPDVPLAAAEHLMDASPILMTGMPGGHLAKSFGNAKTSTAVLGSTDMHSGRSLTLVRTQ